MRFCNRKRPEEKKIDLEVALGKHIKLIKPYINVPLLFRSFPVVFLTPTIKEDKIYYRYKTNECLPGHCKLMPINNFIWKFGQSPEWNEAKYRYLKLVDTIKKFKEEGYET